MAAAPRGSRNSTSLSSREMTPSSSAEIDDGLVFGQRRRLRSESTKNVARPPTSSRSRETPGARVVVGFHDDVLELVAKILLDGRLVLLFDFGVIREHADSVKALAAAAFVGGKEFLHRVGGVRAVVQNLRQRGSGAPELRRANRATHPPVCVVVSRCCAQLGDTQPEDSAAFCVSALSRPLAASKS